ncbi:MAG: c-type cytochrome [Gammaproteobacteria bacterium]|nr:c-type cytochrome [Gammaproteobacteria bacterium]
MIKAVALSLIAIVATTPAFAAGDVNAGKSKSQVCAGCHGADGNAMIPNYPKLAGQHASYLLKQLHDFKAGVRKNAIMSAQVTNLSPQDMEDLAAYFASQKRTLGAATDPAMRELGQRIYRGGNETKAVPACMACHSPDGSGNPPAKYPNLGGQNADYVTKTLTDFRTGERGTDSAGQIMHDIAKRMDDAEMKAVAHYVSGLH